ncbi:hypothetical protein TSUD_322210 [Trifolium subterraneum]|uniref:Uncharacterized protein n=1 Tax=Trifolium subterraneum TaxID=3900 RepID=A0A2Z6MEL9_TRISU|nr:hypothetical protein TSUD_322210 [Trifolium subterraneum]
MAGKKEIAGEALTAQVKVPQCFEAVDVGWDFTIKWFFDWSMYRSDVFVMEEELLLRQL